MTYHGLRHSYAAAAIESGGDIKTVQSNLGHAMTSFTLDVYSHVPPKMCQQSADRMEEFIRKVSRYTGRGVAGRGGFAVAYSVSDEEGDELTVTEAVDGAPLRTFTAQAGAENSLRLDGEAFMRLLNGTHTLAITADDGKGSTAHRLTFAKLVTAASVTLERPMAADGPITVCVLSVSGSIPADAEYMVEVANNALDDAPAWEDCTAAVKGGINTFLKTRPPKTALRSASGCASAGA